MSRILTNPRNILLPVALIAVILAFWQLARKDEKALHLKEFETAEYQELDSALSKDNRFSRIRATGRFDDERHLLLDNKIFNGRAGVHVFTPFRNARGTMILVNRGWLPMAPDRSVPAEIPTPAVPLRISGILAPPPENRQTLGDPDVLKRDEWPQLVTYLELEAAADALQADLATRVLWLDPDHEAGFEGRDWKPGTMTPQTHQAYAVQWFAIALAAIGFWTVLVWRERRPK